MRKYKAVIFDLDGTLFDTSPGVLSCVDFTVAYFGLTPLSSAERLSFIGPPLKESFIDVCHMTSGEADAAVSVFRKQYINELCNAKMYEDILPYIQRLKAQNISVGLATNKRQDFAQTLLDHFDLTPYFDSIKGADPNGHLSKADLITICLAEMHIADSSTAVLIGDSKFDAIGAKEANVDFIGVTYGFGFNTLEDINEYPNVLGVHLVKELFVYL